MREFTFTVIVPHDVTPADYICLALQDVAAYMQADKNVFDTFAVDDEIWIPTENGENAVRVIRNG